MATIKIRDATSGDMNLVRDSWIKSYRGGSREMKRLGRMYWPMQSALIGAILSRARVQCLVHPDIDSYVLGWACGEDVSERFCLHYVWIRKQTERGESLRHMGMGQHLVSSISDGKPLVASCSVRDLPSWLAGVEIEERLADEKRD